MGEANLVQEKTETQLRIAEELNFVRKELMVVAVRFSGGVMRRTNGEKKGGGANE